MYRGFPSSLGLEVPEAWPGLSLRPWSSAVPRVSCCAWTELPEVDASLDVCRPQVRASGTPRCLHRAWWLRPDVCPLPCPPLHPRATPTPPLRGPAVARPVDTEGGLHAAVGRACVGCGDGLCGVRAAAAREDRGQRRKETTAAETLLEAAREPGGRSGARLSPQQFFLLPWPPGKSLER